MTVRIESPVQSVALASRRSLLARSALLAGGSALLMAVPQRASADAKPQKKGSEDEFRQIRAHEADHVAFLVQALGNAARPRPTFKNLTQANFTAFADVAQALENTGVAAYLGATPFIDSQAYLAAAGTIALIEARHAGYLNVLHGDPITDNVLPGDSDNSFETPLTAAEIAALAMPFIADLNGGPPVDYAQVRTPENDIAILNFALALEYLESAFYDNNLHKFFPKSM